MTFFFIFSSTTRLAGPWWKGNVGEKRGAFPATYVKVVDTHNAVSAEGKDLSLEGLGGVGGDARQTLPKALAKFDYKATKPTELSFSKGDTIVEVRKMAGEWWRGSCNGQRGYFPKSHVAVIGEGVLESQRGNVFHSEKPPLARAMFDFVGASEHELTFKEGDVIGQVVTQASAAGAADSPWWQGTRGGRTGFFPREYVVLVDAKRRKVPYTATVVYKFDARDAKSQLSLAVGELIEVLELCDEITGGWWVGRKADNKVGYFPANYARFSAKACDRCQKNKAKAKVSLPGRATAVWYCKQCVLDTDPTIKAPQQQVKKAATPAQPQPQQQVPQQHVKASTPAPAPAPAAAPAAAALPPNANDAASQRLAALGMVKKTPSSPAVTKPAPAPVQQVPPPQPQAQPQAQPKLPPPPAAAAQPVKLPPPPAQQQQQHQQQQRFDDDSDDDSDDSDTDDVSTDDEGQEGGGLTYVEMLRQEYRKHLPAPEDMRADYGKAPAPPRPT